MTSAKKYTEAQALKDIEDIIKNFKTTMRGLETRRAALVKRMAERKDNEEAMRVRGRIKSKS